MFQRMAADRAPHGVYQFIERFKDLGQNIERDQRTYVKTILKRTFIEVEYDRNKNHGEKLDQCVWTKIASPLPLRCYPVKNA